MRNESEAITRPEAMSSEAICAVLHTLTIQTEVRIWYWTKEKFKEEQEDLWEDDEDFEMYRDGEEMTEPERSAVELDTCLYATVTDVEDNVEMDALGGMGTITFAHEEDDGIHHIEVVKVGLPPAEELDYGPSELLADPANDYVNLADEEVDVAGVRKLHAALGRWLEYKA